MPSLLGKAAQGDGSRIPRAVDQIAKRRKIDKPPCACEGCVHNHTPSPKEAKISPNKVYCVRRERPEFDNRRPRCPDRVPVSKD